MVLGKLNCMFIPSYFCVFVPVQGILVCVLCISWFQFMHIVFSYTYEWIYYPHQFESTWCNMTHLIHYAMFSSSLMWFHTRLPSILYINHCHSFIERCSLLYKCVSTSLHLIYFFTYSDILSNIIKWNSF